MEKIKILVVDDESRMRKLVKDFLGREGYQVLEAGNLLRRERYCADHIRCHDAEDGRLADMP